MFQGNFKAEVQRSIHELETFLEKELRSVYDDIYVESGRNNVKVRVIVRSEWIEKIINCIFRYHHDDEKFGNIHIELVVSEVSETSRLHFVGKFGVQDHRTIEKAVLQDLLKCIQEI